MKKKCKKEKKYCERLNKDEEKQPVNDKNKKFERLIKKSEIKINKTNTKYIFMKKIIQKAH